MASDLPFTRSDLHILAVDDVPLQLNMVSAALEKLGYKVTTATNGKEAYDTLCSGTKFDLVLSDVMMPVMSGPEFLQTARSDPRFREIPIVMMSSDDQYKIVFDCLSKGADDYIIKPLTPQVLKNIYANVWLKRRQNAAAAKIQHQIVENTVIQKRIAEMKQSFTETVKTPLNDVAAQLEALMANGSIPAEAQGTLTQVINQLKTMNKSGDIAPVGPKIPAPMKDFFQSQFGVGQGKRVAPIAVHANRRVKPPPPSAPSMTSLGLGDKLMSLDFNVWDIAATALPNLAFDIYNMMGLGSTIGAKEGELEHFLKKASAAHRPNPFHNFRRAVGSLQLVAYVLQRTKKPFLPFEAAGCLFAALLHDVEHPGTNNMFQVRTCSQLALLYNDKSVLEQNSASVGARMIQDVFSFSIEDGDFSTLRQTFLNCVLKTDYSKLQKFLGRAARAEVDLKSKESRLVALQVLTLMGDLSFAIRQWKTAGYWYEMMRDEQFQQGDMERKRGMKTAALMDSRIKRPNTELIKTHFTALVIPVFHTGVRFFPELESELLGALQRNLNIINEMEAVEKATPAPQN